MTEGHRNQKQNSDSQMSGLKNFQFRVSVIVPVYNQEPYLEKSIGSLLAQTMPLKDFEILLIDDGSTDASPEICDIYAELFNNVRVIHKENGGLSDARNCGIDHAQGKYLMYLDADDSLKPDTLLHVVNFFDKHYDEIDLVAYPSITIKNGKPIAKHYRYSILQNTGIYDLTKDENIFAAITRIEVCVKNLGESNVRFSSDRNFRHEDEKYCTDIILNKLKIGFVDTGGYIYEQQPDGLQNTTFFAYYLFEPTMSFWEEEFAKYDNIVPKYLQALYMSDLSWKFSSSILLPYHYEDNQLRHAKSRVLALLRRVDTEVIISHPVIDSFHRAFWLQLKDNCVVNLYSGNDTLELVADGIPAYHRTKVEVIILRVIPNVNTLEIHGFIKSPCFQFGEKPKLYANTLIDNNEHQEEINLTKSSWCYYKAKSITNTFWNFSFTLEAQNYGSVKFIVDFHNTQLNTNFFFMPRAIFSTRAPKWSSFIIDCYIYGYKENSIYLRKLSKQDANNRIKKRERGYFRRNKRQWIERLIAKKIIDSNTRIWLYHDCHGVEKNNAYYQFIHDFNMNDGIERYYVVNDPLESKRHLFSAKQMKYVISFRSETHRIRFLAAEKIITAYVEKNNWMPFTEKEAKWFLDIWRADVIYLQHGVLHATLPWKYSADRLLIDYEVVSTQYEIDNLSMNYCFEKKQLITAGMPRYDYLNPESKHKRKILLAPSWRKYLVRAKGDGQWYGVPGVFEKSKFAQELDQLFKSARLLKLLEDNDFVLELKLHPILSEFYKDFFVFNTQSIVMADESVNEEDYAIFITDYSSYRFDFVYLKRAIVYFFPDEELFKSGMCDYRMTDLPLDGQFGDMAHNADELIDLLTDLIKDDCKPKDKYSNQMNDFFLHYDNNQCNRIYQALITNAESDK